MFTIKTSNKHEIIIKKSRFICLLYKINDKQDIDFYLKNVKDEYKNATHYCYAYILDNIEKASDDKEPSGTAGIPMLNILKYKNLNHVLAIVVRYFGGIKLGTGGLFKAYTTILKETIELSDTENEIIKYKYYIETALDNSNVFDKLKDVEIKNKFFKDIIEAEIISIKEIDEILTNLNIKIIDKEKYI